MAERGTCPKFLMKRSKGRQKLGCCLAVCGLSNRSVILRIKKDQSFLVGCPALPFIGQGGSRAYKWEKEEKTKGRKCPLEVLGLPFPLSLPC